MPHHEFDHLALGAADLSQGIAWFNDATGLTMPPGGVHPLMGTHNCLTAAGNDAFLEIIAIDPAAERPRRTRWFAMDEEATAARVSQQLSPTAWVLRTDDIEASLEIVKAHGFDIGPAIELTRGDLSWKITVREDGQMPGGASVPVLIQWPDGPHPSRNMTDLGVRFDYIRLFNDVPERLKALLADLGCEAVADVQSADGRDEGVEVGLVLPDGRRVVFG